MMDVSSYDCIDGQTIPALLFATFQMRFALMVLVLITGAWAEKFNFYNSCLFMIICPFLVYYPIAHWIWGGGWLTNFGKNIDTLGVLDYAGGLVIHTTFGISSLVISILL